jgi:hypothetical protein
MGLYDFLYRLKVFSKMLKVDKDAEIAIESHTKERSNLNERLEKVTRATLNGESSWFLRAVKKDPNCILEVIKECKLKEENGGD